MPRVSKDTKERILAAAKAYLRLYPDSPVSMRKIADLCGVSPGTIYNHYPDKDSLMGDLMIEDWQTVSAEMDRSSADAISLQGGVKEIYRLLSGFISRYRSIWMDYRAYGNYVQLQSRRHRELINEMTVYVRRLLERFARKEDMIMSRILAENILITAMQEEIPFEALKQLVSYIAK